MTNKRTAIVLGGSGSVGTALLRELFHDDGFDAIATASGSDRRDSVMTASKRLERLKGSRAGQYSIRINQQYREYRVCFTWKDGYANEVEIVDYH